MVIPPGSELRSPGWLAGLLADWDMLLLLALILADVRVFNGSKVASFTLYELFAWGYCAPFVVGRLIAARAALPAQYACFLAAIGRYLAWIMLASLFALFGRQSVDVLQQAKNILPALPLAAFILIRVQRPGTVARLANLYVLYCVADCALAIEQWCTGGPYLRAAIENNDYKLDFGGDLVGHVILGFSSTPNELAVVVLPGLMFTAMKLATQIRQYRFPDLLAIFCCATSGLAFILAQSRGAVLWFLFGFLFIRTAAGRTRSFSLKLVIVAALIAIITVVGLHAASNGADVENTIDSRLMLWKLSLASMADDPYVAILGDGMAYVKSWSWKAAGWEFPDAHNGWLDQALFFGLPALFLYAGIWRIFFALTDAPTRKIEPETRILLDGIRASVLALMGLYFFEPVAHSVFPVSQLFLLMACGVWLSTAGKASDSFLKKRTKKL